MDGNDLLLDMQNLFVWQDHEEFVILVEIFLYRTFQDIRTWYTENIGGLPFHKQARRIAYEKYWFKIKTYKYLDINYNL